MRCRHALFALLIMLAAPHLQAAVEQQEAVVDWPAVLQADIDAADLWVREAYPGMVDPDAPELAGQWQAAVTAARERARTVDSLAGWRALMSALVRGLRDGHVGLWFAGDPPALAWAGIALERRGERYVARRPADAAGFDARVADGAELLSCDGLATADLMPARLDGWVTDWRVLAQRSASASELFVDRGNPFLKPVGTCVFRHADKQQSVAISWQRVEADALQAHLAPYTRSRRQQSVGLHFGAAGEAWIEIGRLDDFAALDGLRAQLEQQRERVLTAPYRVFDLRGNGGGDSRLGDALIVALWGEQALIDGTPAGPKRWRASPLTLAQVQRVRDALHGRADANPNLLRMAESLLQRLPEAIAAGQDFLVEGGGESAAASPAQASDLLRTRYPSFVLTDGGCFSSCIMLNQRLKRAGAVHVGDPSDRHTMYGEAWFSQALPSGNASLSLPIAINPYPRGELGGEPPAHSWDGAGDDERGLRNWIAGLAATRAR